MAPHGGDDREGTPGRLALACGQQSLDMPIKVSKVKSVKQLTSNILEKHTHSWPI